MLIFIAVVLAVLGLVSSTAPQLRGNEHVELEASSCKPLGVTQGGSCVSASYCESNLGRSYRGLSCLFCCTGSSDICCVMSTPVSGSFSSSSSMSTSSTSSSSSGTYCPKSRDLVAAYGNPSIQNQGWTISGGGGVATRAAFNLLGGSVEYDLDVTGVNIGVNANMYTISPTFSGSFGQGAYCDGQKLGNLWCLEIDWIETNGGCGGATALHTFSGTGSGCSNWGCAGQYAYNGRTSFHMRIDTDKNGVVTVTRDGKVVSISENGSPGPRDWSKIKSEYGTKGAVIYSSQWVGWVPSVGGRCSASNGNLGSSKFVVSNLRITAAVINGPVPNLC